MSLLKLGEGAVIPLLPQLEFRLKIALRLEKPAGGCVDDWKSSLCNKYMSIRGYQTTKHCIAVYRLII